MSASILSAARVLPEHYADQETLLAAFRKVWAREHFNLARLEQLHRAVQVNGRHLALPLEAYKSLHTFAERNAAWVEAATVLAERAVGEALRKAGLAARDVDQIFFVTVTGLATPSIDARLVERLGLRDDVKRTPIFGLGCVGGAAGLARAADAVRGSGEVAVLVSAEICSLTLQREDLSIPNIIASGLFGDGAAAVVIDGRARGGPRIAKTRSVFYPRTERMMGWDIVDSGFKVVLSAQVPKLVKERIGGDVSAFLDGQRVQHWIAHTGGPKVLEAFEEALALPADALARSWKSLREVGNLSSASVLFVLADLLDSGEPRAGEAGLLMAMGPGFCAELVLLQW